MNSENRQIEEFAAVGYLRTHSMALLWHAHWESAEVTNTASLENSCLKYTNSQLWKEIGFVPQSVKILYVIKNMLKSSEILFERGFFKRTF